MRKGISALMYHYVRPTMEAPPYGYYHLPLESFRSQLDHLQAEYDLLSKERFFACVRGERTPPEDAAVLTFDDGLKDHHRWVLPELERRDLWGVFFVPTGPLVDGRRLPVHRIHTLAGAVPGDRLVERLLSVLREEGVFDPDAGEEEDMYGDRETPEQVRTFKRILNQEVPYRALDGVLDRLEASFPDAGVAVDTEELYLTADEVADLDDAGMTVGAHSISHRILSRLPDDEQRAEIVDSKDYLESLTDGPVRAFAYPYGTPGTYDDETVRIVEEEFDAAFTTEERVATAEALEHRPLRLPRFDCTAFPHGESREGLPEVARGTEHEVGTEALD